MKSSDLRVVTDPDVEEIFFDESTDADDIRIVRLRVQHRSAIVRETNRVTRATSGRSEDQLGA